MYEVLAIVKDRVGNTVGYDIRDLSTGSILYNVSIERLRDVNFSNAIYVNGKRSYIKGKKSLQVRIVTCKITLFHGSNQEVRKPMLGQGKKANDYGQGFYTTTEKERAEEWALLMGGNSICNEYQLDANDLRVCNLDDFGPLAWIAEVLYHRGSGGSGDDRVVKLFCKKYCIDTSKYDIMCGYRADDSYFTIIKSFIANEITVDEVVQFFYKAKLGTQVFIKSPKAFQAIEFIRANKVKQTRLTYARNNDSKAREVVRKFIEQRRYDVITGKASLNGKMTISNCVQHNYKYNTERKIYYE